jgi:hypothetical protein
MKIGDRARATSITFSTPLVPKVFDGSKTQIRRAIKPQPLHIEWFEHQKGWCAKVREGYHEMVKCPYVVGDVLRIKETWNCWAWGVDECDPYLWSDISATDRQTATHDKIGYSDQPPLDPDNVKWMPARYMPAWASRGGIEILSVRAQRVCDISEEDAAAEGVCDMLAEYEQWDGDPDAYRKCFRVLWEKIYPKTNPWLETWVWAVEFRVVTS